MPQLLTRPHCPVCQSLLDGYAAADSSDAAPGPGDFSICSYCFSVLEFDGDGLLVVGREAAQEQLKDLVANLKARSSEPGSRLGIYHKMH